MHNTNGGEKLGSFSAKCYEMVCLQLTNVVCNLILLLDSIVCD